MFNKLNVNILNNTNQSICEKLNENLKKQSEYLYLFVKIDVLSSYMNLAPTNADSITIIIYEIENIACCYLPLSLILSENTYIILLSDNPFDKYLNKNIKISNLKLFVKHTSKIINKNLLKLNKDIWKSILKNKISLSETHKTILCSCGKFHFEKACHGNIIKLKFKKDNLDFETRKYISDNFVSDNIGIPVEKTFYIIGKYRIKTENKDIKEVIYEKNKIKLIKKNNFSLN